ncbi:hypothetical protein DFH11DRAFT_1568777 [Phellopilus nigrolimitatus]|nr:hypothetical protein DFH11DRAFT_1568777 [Phellopilus nigrolimitatus]
MVRDVKGKKRTQTERHDTPSRAGSSSLSPAPEEQPKPKRSKRAETRTCPVCDEKIPIRLLGAHADLEMNRVEDILRGVGPSAVDSEAGPSTSRRGAALKARRSMNPRGRTDMNTVDQIEKMLKLLQRNRKGRHIRLKEIIAQDDDERAREVSGNEMACPVCMKVVRGDADVIDAHVDSCVANASRLQAEAEERGKREREGLADVDPWGEVEVDGQIRIHLNNVSGLRGTGVHIRDQTQLDVEEEVDVDGDDEFGTAQFTEKDVMDPSFIPNALAGDGEDDDDRGKSLRNLVAEGKVVARRTITPNLDGVRAEIEQVMGVGDTDRMNQAIITARNSGNTSKLVSALEDKIEQLEAMRVSSSTSLLCRICLDPYNEPTVSTGCWHTCCRECWLRCLGSTKLCPICKRITAATDLRRVYM